MTSYGSLICSVHLYFEDLSQMGLIAYGPVSIGFVVGNSAALQLCHTCFIKIPTHEELILTDQRSLGIEEMS